MKRTLPLGVAALSFGLTLALCVADDKPEAKAQKVDLASDLVAQAPANWMVQASTKQFRLFEITLPSPEKDGTDGVLVITHFGKGAGGSLADNLKRWYGMIEQPDGSSTEKAAKKVDMKNEASKITITWLDMSGTYLDRPSPMSQQVTKRPKYRVFAAMIDGGKDGPYWVRAYGPDSVMQAHRDGFERFLKSIAKK